MKRFLSRVLAVLLLLAFVAIILEFLYLNYRREKQQSSITQISIELREIQDKYAAEKLSEARDQMRMLHELFALERDSQVRLMVLPTYAQMNSVLGFQSEAEKALHECVQLVETLTFSVSERANQYCSLANAACQSECPELAAKLLAQAESLLAAVPTIEEKGVLSFRIADAAALQRNIPKVEEYQAKLESFMKQSPDVTWKTKMQPLVQTLKEMRQDLQTEANAKKAEQNMSAQEKLDRN